MVLLSFADFFFKINLNFFYRNTTRESNSLDPDQELCSVCPDLGSNCLPRLSGDDKNRR